jgi:hypothetical protein
MLKDGRRATRQTQEQAARRAGITQSMWSRLETDPNAGATIETWNRAAFAVDTKLNAYLERTSAATQPRDAVHLRTQELIIRTAARGGWRASPEQQIDRDARTSRAADVLLQRELEYALIEIWDWFPDVGAAYRDLDRRRGALERYAITRMTGDELPRTGACWVVRGTLRNRELVQEHVHFFRARFSGSARAWLAALTDPAQPLPEEPALIWVNVKGDRLFEARLRAA